MVVAFFVDLREGTSWMDPTWLPIAERLGFPALVALLAVVAGYKFSKWAGIAIIQPATQQLMGHASSLVDSHNKFLEATIRHQEQIDGCLDTQGKTLDELKDQSVTQTQLLRQIANRK